MKELEKVLASLAPEHQAAVKEAYLKDFKDALNEDKYVGKEKHEALKRQKEALEKGQAKLEADLKKMAESTGTVEELKAKLAESQKETAATKAETEAIRKASEAQVKKMAIESQLRTAGAINPDVVGKMIDGEMVKVLPDGTVEGLKEQIEKVQASDAYMFQATKPSIGASQPQVGGQTTIADERPLANKMMGVN
jgi:myosin heavy subunit